MKKRISALMLLFFILFAVLITSCSQDNGILATSRIKDITKEDFYTWLDTKKIKKESILDSKDKQRDKLTDMALEIFSLEKAKAEGFDRSESFMFLKERARVQTLNKYYLNDIMTRATYNEPAIRVSYILLPLNYYKNDPDDKTRKIRLESHEVTDKLDELTSKAKGIIKRIDEGESFENLAAEFAEDTTRKNNGDFGYITRDMMPDYFSGPAFNLGKGEYTKAPIVSPKGIFIIKVTDKADITEKNIDEIIKDKSQQQRIKARLVQKYKSDYMSRLIEADDVAFLFKKGKSYSDKDIIFKVESREYTIADLYESLKNRTNKKEKENIFENGAIPDDKLYELAEAFFRYIIWTREAARLEIDKKPEYQKSLDQLVNTLLIREYTATMASRSVFISDQEIMEEYDRKYSTNVTGNSVEVHHSKTFNEVKDEIYNQMAKKIVHQKAQDWKKQVIKEYDLKINESALEGA